MGISSSEKLKRVKIRADIYLLKVNNQNSKIICEICSKLTMNTYERPQWPLSGVFTFNIEQIGVSIVDFELVNASRFTK